jgi:hypothetical protein
VQFAAVSNLEYLGVPVYKRASSGSGLFFNRKRKRNVRKVGMPQPRCSLPSTTLQWLKLRSVHVRQLMRLLRALLADWCCFLL